MSIKSMENPNLAKDVPLASGPTAPRSSPGWEESKFDWRKELGEALVRCPQRPLVVRPEGRREAGKVQIPVDLGGGWEKRIREGSFGHLRSPANRTVSISTEPCLISTQRC